MSDLKIPDCNGFWGGILRGVKKSDFFQKSDFWLNKIFLAVNFPVMTFLQRYAHYVFSDLTGFQNLSGLPHHRFFYSKKFFKTLKKSDFFKNRISVDNFGSTKSHHSPNF
jgi:hypothetical protein